ncbi:MAG: threonine synthase [Desulfuromonas sp.]|nr:MAG: threonine synthase [Desulfuromonas sp.]
MRYISTRGLTPPLSFKDAVMMGLASDGGLLLPETIPTLSQDEIAALSDLPYPELAFKIIARFVSDIPETTLKSLIDQSYASFNHKEVTPVVKQDGTYILELFHGPTLAFKDIALQLLGNLFSYLLAERGETMNILGATSGDTGSAAIAGVRGKENINIFILHPHQRVSPIQELQMTTVTDPNVFNLAIRGTFDDGQRIVKEVFGDLDFKKEFSLGAINSINWARVLAQIVYYFFAYAQVKRQTGCDSIYFSVPTGNFGDIFAGYLAKRMGLPIRKLILATNENNILSRFVRDGDYSVGSVVETLSPSMDIQVASNFERYLYYLYEGNSMKVREALEGFQESGSLSFSAAERAKVHEDFVAAAANRQETITTIRDMYQKTGYILDPHTAVGVHVGRNLAKSDAPLVCLATAHPAKFGDAVHDAIATTPPQPESLHGIEMREKRCELIDADTEKIKKYIKQHAY